MKFMGLVIGAAMALSGCGALGGLAAGVSSPFSGGGGVRGARTEIEGIRFRTRVSASRENRRAFTAVTRGAARGPAAAAEAGRAQAIEYCIRTFGGSEIVWSAGPDRAAEALSPDAGGALVLAGTCVSR